MDSTVVLVAQEFKQALLTLDEALQADPKNVFVRDATVKRFEYSFELCWKTVKAYLAEQYGEAALSPKECFRLLGKHAELTPEEVEECLKMVDDRNKTTHTYDEKFISVLYQKITSYAVLLKKVGAIIA